MRVATRSHLAAALLLVLTGCTQSESSGGVTEPEASAATPTTTAIETDLDIALSTPVEDSVYPAVGDPGVDALHYDLELAWQPRRRVLEGTATITLRATADAPRFQLDLARALDVRRATLDGKRVRITHRGKDLVVRSAVTADQRYELVVTYAGKPRPVPAPTTRSDFSTTGFTVTDSGEVWTMQEPYGAYSWYPVNDQPSDKALYDFTIHAPAPWTGIANGALVSHETDGATTTTSWQLAEPASSYLVTLAIGDYAHTSNTTSSGLRIDYWVPRGLTTAGEAVTVAADAMDWIEERLGPYPFDTLGMVVTDSRSAMETQTMVTLGNNPYVLSPPVIQHELVHQWFGDQVSPADWRDVWLNEGMTMLMQWLYEEDRGGPTLEATIDQARRNDAAMRREYGPPGAYRAANFGESNIYYPPAVMWNELRLELGEEKFYAVARSWLAANDNTSTTREELYDHWEKETGLELTAFFDAWIVGEKTPARGLGRLASAG